MKGFLILFRVPLFYPLFKPGASSFISHVSFTQRILIPDRIYTNPYPFVGSAEPCYVAHPDEVIQAIVLDNVIAVIIITYHNFHASSMVDGHIEPTEMLSYENDKNFNQKYSFYHFAFVWFNVIWNKSSVYTLKNTDGESDVELQLYYP